MLVALLALLRRFLGRYQGLLKHLQPVPQQLHAVHVLAPDADLVGEGFKVIFSGMMFSSSMSWADPKSIPFIGSAAAHLKRVKPVDLIPQIRIGPGVLEYFGISAGIG